MRELYMISGTEDGIRLFSGEEEINNYLHRLQELNMRIVFGHRFDEGENLIIRGEIIKAKPKQVINAWDFT